MAATIKDVARLAGVSPSTVSRVLNQKGVISDETKQKIASAMEQLKYVPNDISPRRIVKKQKNHLTLPLRGDDTILPVNKDKEDCFMVEPCIRVRNLTKTFGGRAVVNDLSFAVEKGEVFALLGHNGAGKSTTIDLILGLKTPDRGSTKILGMDAAKHRKQVFERVGVQLHFLRFCGGDGRGVHQAGAAAVQRGQAVLGAI